MVIRAVKALCQVFCDVLPGYRIKEQKPASEDVKVSKDVQSMREHEQFVLGSYKEYLKILEIFSKTKPEKIIKQKGITDEAKRLKALEIYRKLRELSFLSFCRILRTHPHFNYRLNVLQLIMPRLATKDLVIRNECTVTVFELLKSEDNTLLDFKLEVLRELSKTVRSRDHSQMDPTLLDCLVTHQIIVDESKARMVDASQKKLEQMKAQMEKLRKKGKFAMYREMKQQLLTEMRESGAVGQDLGSTSKMNNQIIKEVLAIYFEVLKNKSESPLLKSVFLGLPSFTQYVNVEIVWDLISVLREYLRMILGEDDDEDEVKSDAPVVKRKKVNV